MSIDSPVLDAREIDGPPFSPIMDALEELDEGETLTLINAFEPRPLYEVVESRGFAYATEQVADDEWHVEIEHACRGG